MQKYLGKVVFNTKIIDTKVLVMLLYRVFMVNQSRANVIYYQCCCISRPQKTSIFKMNLVLSEFCVHYFSLNDNGTIIMRMGIENFQLMHELMLLRE